MTPKNFEIVQYSINLNNFLSITGTSNVFLIRNGENSPLMKAYYIFFLLLSSKMFLKCFFYAISNFPVRVTLRLLINKFDYASLS